MQSANYHGSYMLGYQCFSQPNAIMHPRPSSHGKSFDGVSALSLYSAKGSAIRPEYPTSPCAFSNLRMIFPTIFAIQRSFATTLTVLMPA
jgi:hypothetical protein